MRRRWASERSGSVTILFALLSVVLFASAAIALDLVTVWIARRNAQGAADLAAILAASSTGSRDATARRSLADNGFANDLGTASVIVGLYKEDRRVAPNARFVPQVDHANAVRVSFQTHVATVFSKVIGLPSSFDVRVSATARTADFAAFTVGSGLVVLNGGVANAILGSLLGTTVSLGIADYNALASANVDAFRYLDALGVQAGLTAADYDRILAANVTPTQALTALSATIPGGTATQTINSLSRSLGSQLAPIPISSLVELGDIPTGSRPSFAGPPLNALAALTNAIAIANGATQVSVDLGPSIPGIARTRLIVTIGQRKQSSGLVQVDSAKATVRTGQARALFEATVTLPLASITLPVYLEAAKAVGTLASVTCPWSDPTKGEVAIDAKPGVADLAIAAVPHSAIDLTKPSPSLTEPARLLSLPLLSVTGLARATWDAPFTQRLVFSNADIVARRIRTVSSTQAVSSITASLLSNLRLDVNGIDLTAILGLQRTLKPALEAIAAPLDGVIDTTLRMLGLRLGFADVTVDAIRCGRAVLVQ